jgi:TPP-dependent pyruvate/acetoin dehydrogenase alpha subunit
MTKSDSELTEAFYRSIYLIRRTEEEVARIYPTDKIKSPIHLSIGQEAVAVGVCEALRSGDVVFGTYRGHAMYLAKKGSLKGLVAELYGKSTGCAKGKGGSMHLIDVASGVMGTSAIVGTTIPLAAGYAYGLKYKQSDSVVVSFFGDGAVDEGAFHESMNFAALRGLPVLFICENNFYAIHSHYLTRRHSGNITERAKAYGMPAEKIENGDVFEIYERTKAYIEKIRKGEGPAFLECMTCRWKEHVGPNDDFHLGYRSEKEVLNWKKEDELKKLKSLLGPAVSKAIESDVEQKIKEAFDFAEQSSFPESEALYDDIFKES